MEQQLSQKMQDKITFYRSMRREEARPFFEFPPLLPSVRLQYLPLDYDNYHILHELFAEEDNPFINLEFKEKEKIGIYVVDLREFAKFSPKRGAFDWLIYWEGQPIGVLHLFDLSRERANGKHKKCTIGFSIGQKFRRNGFAFEAISHQVEYIFEHFGDIERIIAYTFPNNKASIGVLKKVGFALNTKDYLSMDRYSFFEKWRAKR
ncbi:MAG: GNAT family N-acetyltransferase [Saprospiraceae bacterium]|nr:GNAT family N-acetyltransferase [Saprospiraceae bacterium]